MDYKETIDFLYQQLPMFSRDGASAFKKDLSNTLALCKALDNPETKFKSIHIAGTNGKGSSSHMLAAIFQKAGYKTGLYTSPHLYDFRERIRVDGELCSKDFVVRFVEKIQPFLAVIQPSFFEITVAMAFEYFVEQNIDIAIIETGLGGRLDSTNVVIPELSLITNIGYDHMQFLGNTLPEIAGEKAGIIKKDRPVVISEYLPETISVFDKMAARMEAPIFLAQDLWRITEQKGSSAAENKEDIPRLAIRALRVDTTPLQSESYQLDLTGHYQLKNVAGVLEAIYQMQRLGWAVSQINIYEGLKNVKSLTGFVGRWDQVLKEPWMITDVGHNVDGIRMIRDQLSHMQYNDLHIITGFVKDKDVSASLRELPENARYYFTQAPIPRALDAGVLKEMAAKLNLQGGSYPEIASAITAAVAGYQSGDLILICGSVFLVAEVKGALTKLGLLQDK